MSNSVILPYTVICTFIGLCRHMQCSLKLLELFFSLKVIKKINEKD